MSNSALLAISEVLNCPCVFIAVFPISSLVEFLLMLAFRVSYIYSFMRFGWIPFWDLDDFVASFVAKHGYPFIHSLLGMFLSVCVGDGIGVFIRYSHFHLLSLVNFRFWLISFKYFQPAKRFTSVFLLPLVNNPLCSIHLVNSQRALAKIAVDYYSLYFMFPLKYFCI